MYLHHRNIISNRFLWVLLTIVVFALSGCRNNEDPNMPVPVVFTSQVEGEANGGNAGEGWINGSRIGVFAIKNETILQQSNIVDNNQNLPFITGGDNLFQPQTKPIFYSPDGSKMDIIAYYPFTERIENYTFPINIITQIDFLYSNNVQGIGIGGGNHHQLIFTRPLSRLIINIASSNELPLTNLTAVMNGAKTRADFLLATGELVTDENSVMPLPLVVSSSLTGQKQISILMLPTSAYQDIKITFRVGSKTHSWALPSALEAGKVHVHNIAIEGCDQPTDPTDPSIPIAPLYLFMEIPVYSRGVAPPNTIELRHKVGDRSWLNPTLPHPPGVIRNFTVLFDTKNRLPVWVAYPLHPIYLAWGNRTDNWTLDPLLSSRHQPFLSNYSWRTSTGQSFDRGHVIPSADRSATQALNRTTFYMSNVVIQSPAMNRGVWERLEDEVRAWSRANPTDTIYVVSGQILHSPPIFAARDNNGVYSAKPQYMYKAILRRNMRDNTFTSIGFKMSNTDDSAPHTESIVSVARLEEITGFTFFPRLPEEVAEEVKANEDMSRF